MHSITSYNRTSGKRQSISLPTVTMDRHALNAVLITLLHFGNRAINDVYKEYTSWGITTIGLIIQKEGRNITNAEESGTHVQLK